jgi:hypothetical protein
MVFILILNFYTFVYTALLELTYENQINQESN